MRKRDFLINSVEKVKEFNRLASNYMEDIDVGIGRYIVDAASLLGIFSLNLAKPVTVTIHTDDEEQANKFFNEVEEVCK